MKELSISESIILLAVLRLKEEAYGVMIKKHLEKTSEKSMSFGTLYSFLDQLSRKGYVSKTTGGATSERGGRSKIYYSLTPEGTKALKEAYRLQTNIWENFSELVIE